MARRLNWRGKLAVFILTLSIFTVIVWLVWNLFAPKEKVQLVEDAPCEYLSAPTNYVAGKNDKHYSFNDLNEVHIASASTNGIPPIDKVCDFDSTCLKYPNEAELVRIQQCKYYVIGELTHSQPYLVPKAKQLLDEIGERFYKKLEFHKLPNVRFSVNSLLRTKEQQKQLGRRNSNAAKESAHVYGTTFDISYKGFINSKGELVNNGKLKRLLIEAIGELRDEGRCFSKSEVRQACYHITVAN